MKHHSFSRDKLENSNGQSITQLSDIELLATFIHSDATSIINLEQALALITHFGDLRAILNANFFSLQQKGLNDSQYLRLQIAREICRRSDLIDLKKGKKFTSSIETYTFIKRQLRDKKNETFAALFLDSQYRLITYEELFHGTINTASVHPRPLIERALSLNAAALIIAHNHPSGLAEASVEDLNLTKRLHVILEVVDVQLLDHLVIGDNEVFSIMSKSKWACH